MNLNFNQIFVIRTIRKSPKNAEFNLSQQRQIKSLQDLVVPAICIIKFVRSEKKQQQKTRGYIATV